MDFKGAFAKLKRFLPEKNVSKKHLLIFAVPVVLIFALLSYEGFIYARTMKVVGDGDDYFKLDKLSEALAKYQDAASVWSRSLILRQVKSSPTDWRIAKTEKSIANLPKALTPEIEIVSWEATNLDCLNLKCNEISVPPRLILPAYAACGHWSYCPSEVTVLNAILKNESSFPAFFVEAILKYGDAASYEILKSSNLTYIPPNGSYIIQRVLEIAPKGYKPSLEVKGIAYYENSDLHTGFHTLKVASFSIFKKDGWPYFRIKLKNETKRTIGKIGFEVIFEPLGIWTYGTVPFSYGEAHAYPLTKEIVDETKPGRPTVEKYISIRSGGTETIEGYLDLGMGAMGTPDFFIGLKKIVYARAFGLEE